MIIPIVPMGAVRQTRADAWKERPVVLRYRAYCDELRLKLPPKYMLPEELPEITFILPMPKSWSKKKRLEMRHQPHQQKPDLDNLVKGFMDTVAKEDSHLWKMKGAQKRWDEEGAIFLDDPRQSW